MTLNGYCDDSNCYQIVYFPRGARVCGLKDSAVLCASQGTLHFPSHYPDTEAGRHYQNDVATEQMNKYNRKPASKRTNYLKYGVASPFDPPWRELVQNWCTCERKSNTVQRTEEKPDETREKSGYEQKIFVLRNRRVLGTLSKLCQCEDGKNMNANESKLVETILNDESYRTALLPVQIEMVSKGIPSAMSMICIPTEQDLKDFQGKKDWKPPQEPKHKVPKFSTKGKTKAKTKELKKKLTEKLEEKRKSQVENIRSSCCREVAGFVYSGGFDLPSGYGSGVGFITVAALKTLLALRKLTGPCAKPKYGAAKIMVLVRNTTSLKYRCASLSVFHSSIKLC